MSLSLDPAEVADVEPRLKVERLMTPVTVWSSCTALCTTERIVLIGTEEGNINLVTYQGEEVRRHVSAHELHF